MSHRGKLVDQNNVDTFVGYDFGDRLNFTVGCSFLAGSTGVNLGSVIGMVRGIYKGWPKSWSMPKKLIMNNLFNGFGREGSKYANAYAGAGLLYVMVAGTLKTFFEDEMSEMSNLSKNVLAGAITGGLFKCLKGPVGFGVGSVVGATIMATLTKVAEYANEKGYFAGEIKY